MARWALSGLAGSTTEFIVNPTYDQIDQSDLDLRIAGTRDAILMVEAGANEVPEQVLVDALAFGHEAIQPLVDIQDKMRAEVGKPKREAIFNIVDEDLVNDVYDRFGGKMNALLDAPHTPKPN